MKLLYSVNSWVAYKICELYYQDSHYVWCAPFFNANGENPPSSDPSNLCKNLVKDILGKDKHSACIAQNRTGLIKGAGIQLNKGIINTDQHNEILEIAGSADFLDFRPLLYVIPYQLVANMVKPAAMKIKANFFSKEFIIEDLKKDHFDVLDILNLTHV